MLLNNMNCIAMNLNSKQVYVTCDNLTLDLNSY